MKVDSEFHHLLLSNLTTAETLDEWMPVISGILLYRDA